MSVDSAALGFFEKLNRDATLQSELQDALRNATDRTDAIVAFAGKKGFEFDRKSFETARSMLSAALKNTGALEDSELEAVAGGLNPQPEPPSVMFNFIRTIQPSTWTLLR